MKNFENLGKALNRKEQKVINGGNYDCPGYWIGPCPTFDPISVKQYCAIIGGWYDPTDNTCTPKE